jgi:hypothetical protein
MKWTSGTAELDHAFLEMQYSPGFWAARPNVAHPPLILSRGGGFSPNSNPETPYIYDAVETADAVYLALNSLMYVFQATGTVQTSVLRHRAGAPEWDSLGTANAAVRAVAVGRDGELYVAGDFTNIQGIPIPYVARYNGTQWETMGSVNASVYYLRYDSTSDRLYASGYFSQADGRAITDRVAYWTNGAWYGLEVDLPGTVFPAIELLSDGKLAMYGTFVGTAVLPGETTLTMQGKARAAPIITLSGAGALAQVSNVTTGDRLYFQNLTLATGETLTLDFDRGAFTSSTRGNLLPFISSGSRLVGWSFVPGENVITISGLNAGTFTASYTYRDRYWSVDT